ncbi:hypothetical protein SAMN05216281_10524 [Cryobacterium luteum]|nr:hypothetical protein SAMN05216281_10524 [Cryobacterium luteum]
MSICWSFVPVDLRSFQRQQSRYPCRMLQDLASPSLVVSDDDDVRDPSTTGSILELVLLLLVGVAREISSATIRGARRVRPAPDAHDTTAASLIARPVRGSSLVRPSGYGWRAVRFVMRTSCSSSSTKSRVAAMPRHRYTFTVNLVDIAKLWLLRRAQMPCSPVAVDVPERDWSKGAASAVGVEHEDAQATWLLSLAAAPAPPKVVSRATDRMRRRYTADSERADHGTQIQF